MNRFRYFFSLLVILACVSIGCKEEDLTPIFVAIEEANLKGSVDVTTLNTDLESSIDHTLDLYELEVAKSQSFKNVYIIVNNDDVRGYWELPCKIPILTSGKVKLQIFPVIEVNGNSSYLSRYLFMTACEKEVTVAKGESVTLKAEDISFKYTPNDNIIFPLLESFQQSTSFSKREIDMDSSANINIVYDQKKQDNVGVIKLNKDTASFDLISGELVFKSGGGDGRKVLLQIDYRMEYQLESGFTAQDIAEPILSTEVRYTDYNNRKCHDPLILFRYTKEWKSVYVDIGTIIGSAGTRDYTIRDFLVNLTGYLPEGCKTANFFFDNVKIVAYDE